MCLYTAYVAKVAGNRLTNFLLRADVDVKFNYWLVKMLYVLFYSSTLMENVKIYYITTTNNNCLIFKHIKNSRTIRKKH